MVTIRDVARGAGVSVATVSRAFNRSGPVREATRRRIEVVAAELRYSPNGAARSLITRRTHTVGVLLPDLYGEFFSELIRGLDQTARGSAYHLLVSSSHDDRAEIEAALRAMRGRVDGIVIMSPHVDAESLRANLPEALPVVLLNCAAMQGSGYDALSVDNAGGALAMTRHLLSCGRTRIALIRGPAGNHDAEERERGYREALSEWGGGEGGELLLDGDFTEESGYRAAAGACGWSEPPDALFAANDAMAMGALAALREAEVRVPEEIALAGFDDIPIARYTTPPLATVHVPICELGERAMLLLLDALTNSDHEPRREVVSTTLVVRGSAGGPEAG